VRSGKGEKDRVTVLPDSLTNPLQVHLARVRSLHERDLAGGFGRVYLPRAPERKYPNANREWRWQYVFPSLKRSAIRSRMSSVVTTRARKICSAPSKRPRHAWAIRRA